MHPTLNIAIRAAREGAEVVLRHIDRLHTLTPELSPTGRLYSQVDMRAEDKMMQVLHRSFPQHAFLAESAGQVGNSPWCWVIDPLDGVENYLREIGHFAVSIALKHAGHTEQAVIYDPIRQELFSASVDQGAWLNQKRLRLPPIDDLTNCFFATNGVQSMPPSLVSDIAGKMGGLRQSGSIALDMAYLAAGRLDALWIEDFDVWQVAAGDLIVREAGGLIGGLDHKKDYLGQSQLLAANPKIYDTLMRKLRAAQPPPAKS